MKVGDLVRWKEDGDIGIVVDIDDGDQLREGATWDLGIVYIIKWCGETCLHELEERDSDEAEIINESR